MEKEILLKVNSISKTFGPVKALKEVSFEVRRGEIRGLIGENGSGKSTISSIIAGMQLADSGFLTFMGKEYKPVDAVQAQQLGVSMVVQESGIIPGVTVAENIFVGKEKRFSRMGIIDLKRLNKEAQSVLNKLGLENIRPSMMVDTLNFEDCKLIEIARAIYEDPEILIIDETTTALSHAGRKILYNLMKNMSSEGKAVLFVSHDLEELMQTCNELTVLRDGVVVAEVSEKEYEENRVKHLMVGRDLEGDYYRADYDSSSGSRLALEMKHVTTDKISDFSMDLYEGEILGICGLSESGIHEIGRLAFGIDKPIYGTIRLPNKKTDIVNPQESIQDKLGYVSKNRDTETLILDDSILNNLVVTAYDSLSKLGFIPKKRERTFARRQVDYLSIKCSSVEQLVQTLSGGNKQKVAFGRWIGLDADVLILDCPTRGVDIGVKTAMYQLLYRLKKEGKSLLIISEELPELIGMSDRLLVIKNGTLVQEFKRSKELSEQQIIEYMI